MNLTYQTLEAVLFVCALTLDGFAASFAYGSDRIRIPLFSALIVDFVCTAMLALSLFLGAAVRAYIPGGLLKILCFGILFLLGLFKCFDQLAKSLIKRKDAPFLVAVYASPEAADADRSKVLSARRRSRSPLRSPSTDSRRGSARRWAKSISPSSSCSL